MNKIVLAAIGILSTVLIIILIVLSFNKQPSGQNNTITPTTIPNDFRTSPRNQTGTQITPQAVPTLMPQVQKQLIDQYTKQYVQDVSKLSQRQKDNIAKIAGSLPIITPDFELSYSPLTNEFFLRKATPLADQKFQDFLKTNDLIDLYTDHPDFFIQTSDSVTKAQQTYENRYTESIEAITSSSLPTSVETQQNNNSAVSESNTSNPNNSTNSNAAPTPSASEQDKQALGDLFKLFTSFSVAPDQTQLSTNSASSSSTSSQQVPVNTAPPGSLPNGSVPIEDTVVVQGIRVNKLIAAQIDALLTAAHNAGLKLSGGGYRSYEDQVDTRKANCGTSYYNIYQEPSNQCKPPTAIPGHSMHERGLAIDFTCNGNIVSNSDPCHAWLVANANKFGLLGNSVEAWHWSTNGN